MFRFFVILSLLAAECQGLAQSLYEEVCAYTDKDCYLTGECLYVRVDVTSGGKPSTSRVAYVEIADTRKMHAQCMVELKDGQGWARIDLPVTMHSGCYQLAAYTRISQRFAPEAIHRSFIGVINADKLSRLDDIVFYPADSCHSTDVQVRYKAGAMVSIPLPQFDSLGGCVSIQRGGLSTQIPNICTTSLPVSHSSVDLDCPEVEGHIVRAKAAQGSASDVWMTRLALIGRTASLYDGQRQSDGTYLYYTSGISGHWPVMVNAYDSLGQYIQMELISPYLSTLPQYLPKLAVYCQEETLRRRARAARIQALANASQSFESWFHPFSFMSTDPDYLYDLDEYTQMNDVNEMLIEFIKGIKKEKRHGVNQLYTYNPDTRTFAKWAALVLLDGMPIYDVDEILKYDAHLIRYVQVYSGVFNLGSSMCGGVISFITRKGRLSNYKPKNGEQLMSYAFPQDHPTFENGLETEATPCVWLPVVNEKELTFTAPITTGLYQIIFQGRDVSGDVVHRIINFEVFE